MTSVASRLPLPFIQLLLVVLLPAGALAAQARSSMEVSVQVMRGDYSIAAATLIEAAKLRGAAKSAIDSDAKCEAIGSMVSLDGAWTTCAWDPDSHVYLVTVQF